MMAHNNHKALAQSAHRDSPQHQTYKRIDTELEAPKATVKGRARKRDRSICRLDLNSRASAR